MNDSLKETLDRVARDLGTVEPNLPAITKRGRRRRAVRTAASGIVAIVAVAAIGLPLYALSGLGSADKTASGSTLPSNGNIWVRVGGGDGPSFVYQVDPATGVSSPLFNDGQQGSALPGEANPAAVGQQYDWSPDGSRVVFSGWSEDDPPRPVLYTMDADGSHRARIEGSDSTGWGVGAFNAYPSWSPDALQIAYARGENSDVIVDGSRYIAGCESSPSLCRSQIHVIDVTGGNDELVTHEPISASMPDWSPDGRSIAFVSVASTTTTRIGVVGADGGSPTFLTDGTEEDLLPKWSPDGSAIAFLSDRTGRLALYSTPREGGPITLISDVGGTSLPSYTWSPDGSQIALGDGEDLLILAADGSITTRVNVAPRYDVGDVAWRPVSSQETPTTSRATPSSEAPPTASTPTAAIGSTATSGWDFRVVYPKDSLGPKLQGTNYGLPPEGRDFYSSVAREEPPDGIAIQVQEFVGICGCEGFEDVGDTIQLTAADTEPWDSNTKTAFGKAVSFNGQYLSVFVEFGRAADAAALASANEALATVSVDPVSTVSPSGLPDLLPPTFQPSDGWNTASAGGDPSNGPIAWASTAPFDAQDLREGAVSGTLLGHPFETLKQLGTTDVVLVADWWNADAGHSSPTVDQPLQLRDAEVQHQWEGQVADNVPQYVIWGNLDGKWIDVRAFFGTQDPSDSTLARAQAELDRLTYPWS